MLKGMTAQYLLKRTYPVKPGQTILFHAAAGGVGLIAGQWAKHLGVTVIGTVGSRRQDRAGKENGCAHVLNTRERGLGQARARDHGRRGRAGRLRFHRQGDMERLARLPGRARHDGELRQFVAARCRRSSPAFLAPRVRSTSRGRRLASYTRNAQELQETADDLFAVIASGAVKIQIHQRFKLADAAKAHEALHSRKTTARRS